MISALIMMIIAVLLFLGYFLLRKLANNGKQLERKSALGHIEAVLESNGGSQYYRIVFNDDVHQYVGRTSYYSHVPPKRYRKGDTVQILYAITDKGKPLIDIDDSEIVHTEKNADTYLKWLFVAGVVFTILAVITTITSIT